MPRPPLPLGLAIVGLLQGLRHDGSYRSSKMPTLQEGHGCGLPCIFGIFSYLVYPSFSLTLHIDGHKNQQFDTAYQDYVNLFLSCLIFHKKKFLACGIFWFLHNQGKHGHSALMSRLAKYSET